MHWCMCLIKQEVECEYVMVWVCNGKFGWLCACWEGGESFRAMNLMVLCLVPLDWLAEVKCYRNWLAWLFGAEVHIVLGHTALNSHKRGTVSVHEPSLCLETWWVIYRTRGTLLSSTIRLAAASFPCSFNSWTRIRSWWRWPHNPQLVSPMVPSPCSLLLLAALPMSISSKLQVGL